MEKNGTFLKCLGFMDYAKVNKNKYRNKTMKKILEYLKTLPKGKVITYKQLGLIFGIHPRKIAIILKNNKEQDIYPCYKVIKSNGEIGGYNLGIEEKIKRLKKEGIKVKNNKINLKEYLFRLP